VTSTSGEGFSELKRVFYSAIDVLSVDAMASREFVVELCNGGLSYQVITPTDYQADEVHFSAFVQSRVMENAKKAFALACIEQLVPILDDTVIEQTVFPFCIPYVPLLFLAKLFLIVELEQRRHLSDPSYRETYESAHSVILAIFALHAQRVGDGSGAVQLLEHKNYERPFAERIVPFYTRCLIEVMQIYFIYPHPTP
jgi:hypothetical protein